MESTCQPLRARKPLEEVSREELLEAFDASEFKRFGYSFDRAQEIPAFSRLLAMRAANLAHREA